MNARNARMIRECAVSDRTFTRSVIVAMVLVIAAAASPTTYTPVQVAGMSAPAEGASEGNVVDLTY